MPALGSHTNLVKMSSCFHVSRRNRNSRPLQQKPTWRELTRTRDTQTEDDIDGTDGDRGAEWRLESYDLADLLGKWALFFEAQQSGVLSADNRIQWRGDSYLADGLFAAGRWRPEFDLSGGAHFTFRVPPQLSSVNTASCCLAGI